MAFVAVKITGVDKEGIEKDNSFDIAYKYPLILSDRPDDLWVKFFHSAYRINPYDKKRQYSIIEKRIVVIISGEDNKQQQLDFFKEVVGVANQHYSDLLQAKEEEKRKEEARKKRERERILEMREETDYLNFS